MTAETILSNKKVLSLFESDERIMTVYLHGSYATGNERIDSDLDLAVLPKSGFHFNDYERSLLSSDLSFLILKNIDIGELSSRNLVYAKEVY